MSKNIRQNVFKYFVGFIYHYDQPNENLSKIYDKSRYIIWVKVFKKGPSKICRRQPLKNFTCSILEYPDPYVFKMFLIVPSF